MRPAIAYGLAGAVLVGAGVAGVVTALVAPGPFVGAIVGPVFVLCGVLALEESRRAATAARARREARRRARARRGYVHPR